MCVWVLFIGVQWEVGGLLVALKFTVCIREGTSNFIFFPVHHFVLAHVGSQVK